MERINYYDFITSRNNDDCNAALDRMKNRIDMEKISDFIDTVPYINELQRDFYKKYISARYEIIIMGS